MNDSKKKSVKDEWAEERTNKGWIRGRKNEKIMNDWKKKWIKDE